MRNIGELVGNHWFFDLIKMSRLFFPLGGHLHRCDSKESLLQALVWSTADAHLEALGSPAEESQINVSNYEVQLREGRYNLSNLFEHSREVQQNRSNSCKRGKGEKHEKRESSEDLGKDKPLWVIEDDRRL